MIKLQIEKQIEQLHRQEQAIIKKTSIYNMLLLYLIRVAALVPGTKDSKFLGIVGITTLIIEYYCIMIWNYYKFERKRNEILNIEKIKK